MSPTARPRGPLPARVYWVRRAVVLGVPLVLVVVLARVLGGSADGKDTGQATQVAAPTSPSADSSAAPVTGPTAPPAKARKGKKKGTPAPPPTPVLAEPTGPCTNEDILVTPTVTEVPGGSVVPIAFNLRTQTSEACTWHMSADTLAVTITSGSDHIWSSRECPAAITAQDVVVRKASDTPVTVTWDTRRSDEGCTNQREWARLGWYHVQAAALGGEPTDVQFELVAPSAPVVTKTVDPEPANGKKSKNGERREHRAGDDGAGNSDG